MTMKACRFCGRLYAPDAGYCQADGEELVSVSRVSRPEDPSDPLVGQVICDRYLVTRVVADGGVGRVYEGLDRVAERHVALKVLNPTIGLEQISIERFKREYEVSRLLPHRHIVEVTDFQPLNETFVLVMEFLVGEELRSVLRRQGGLSPPRVIRMLSQIALGLGHAHGHQLVHRDLKPDNVFLCQTSAGDSVKILDFGSVKDRNLGAKQLTIIGTTIGSPYYMSPEQAQGLEGIDHRTDVWALAVMVYECLTGTVPFKGNNGPSVLVEILRREPIEASRAAKGNTYIPPAVDRVLAHGMAKAKEARIDSVPALADQLGWAFGLVGNFAEWAYIPERLLEARLAVSALAGAHGSAIRGEPTTLPIQTRDESLWTALSGTKWWAGMAILVVIGGILGALCWKRFS